MLAFLVPGLIFIFLKIFGNNQFDIPVYYKDGLTDAPTECHLSSKGQYYVSDSVLRQVNWANGAALWFSGLTSGEKKELIRVLGSRKPVNLQLVNLDSVDAEGRENVKACDLLMKKPWNAVLTDEQKRIRGYYSLSTREELDRLEIELEILLKK